MNQYNLDGLKYEIRVKAKLGINFIVAGGILWFVFCVIWKLGLTSFNKSVLTFMTGALLLPLAYGLSKMLKVDWKLKDNPLQPLGLWLNFAQLVYFPFLIFILIKDPDYFIMTYAIITGAHLFPYAWYYDHRGYLVSAIVISLGCLLIGLNVTVEVMWIIPLFTSLVLFLFAIWISISLKKLNAEKDIGQSRPKAIEP